MNLLEDTEKPLRSEKRATAFRRYKAVTNARKALWAITSIPTDILKHMNISINDLIALRKKFAHSSKSLSHTFHICNTCNKALRGRNLRKDSLKRYNNICDICKTKEPTWNTSIAPKVRRIRYSLTLEQSRAYVSEHSPEVFL